MKFVKHLTRRFGDVLKEGDSRRQFQWQTVLKKENLKIQQLTFSLIVINDSDSDTVPNSRSMNMELPPTASSFRTPSDSGTSDEPFSTTIDDAIGTAYAEDERTQENFNVLNTNQRNVEKVPFIRSKRYRRPDIFQG